MALLVSIFSVEYLVRERGMLSSYFLLIPELLSGIAMLIVFAKIVGGARISLDWRYATFLGVLLLTIVFGYVVQDVPTGAMVAGVRAYLKFLPFFLLPAVHAFTPRQLKAQLALLLVMLVLETPLAVYQRFIEYAGDMQTGDPVRGTLTTSSTLSLFMVCAIAGLVGAYVRGSLRLAALLALAAWLFAPTTINETKATLLLMPFALVLPALVMPPGARALRKLVPVLAIGALGGVAFVAVYDALIQHRQYADSIGEFISGRGFSYYLYTGAAEHDAEYIGRFDSIQFAIEHTTKDPVTFAFGYGAANVAESFLPQFAGKYASYYMRFGVGQTQITTFLWEIGVIGLLAYLALFAFLAADSLKLARSGDWAGPLGQLWTVVMVVMTFGLLYKSVFSMNDFGYVFWYFSGLVAARAVAVRRAQRVREPRPLPPRWRLAVEGPAAVSRA
jgi:hypothetical protein